MVVSLCGCVCTLRQYIFKPEWGAMYNDTVAKIKQMAAQLWNKCFWLDEVCMLLEVDCDYVTALRINDMSWNDEVCDIPQRLTPIKKMKCSTGQR